MGSFKIHSDCTTYNIQYELLSPSEFDAEFDPSERLLLYNTVTTDITQRTGKIFTQVGNEYSSEIIDSIDFICLESYLSTSKSFAGYWVS